MENKIDFVLLWVDGNDSKWQKEKEKYTPHKQEGASSNRYRDWNNLHYWFRGVEKYASWVNRIHFVTYGHLPKWLNTEHPKLNIVKHSDFIPNEYLPTFSANPIELNLHRIEGLSDHFVYFNDDMFIINEVEPTVYFQNGLPCDSARMCQLPTVPQSMFHHILLNDISALNKNFNKYHVVKNNLSKFMNFRYGVKSSLKNLLYTIIDKNEFSSFIYDHLPAPYLKVTLENAWEKLGDELEGTSKNKFRSMDDINQYIFRYWQFARGQFYPNNMDEYGKGFSIPNDLEEIYNAIKQQEYKMICINDNDENINFEATVKELNKHFDKIFPEKSSFEL